MNYAPNTKVSTGAVAGAIVTVIVAALDSYGVAVTPELAGALVVLIGFGISYLIPEPHEHDRPSRMGQSR